MATDIQIYQGNQIGGCVTVITCRESSRDMERNQGAEKNSGVKAGTHGTDGGRTTRIMIDYGQSLPGAERGDFQYDWEGEPVDGVLFTHYHGDHAGRFLEIPPETKLYMGAAAKEVMINIYRALAGARDKEVSAFAGRALTALQDDQRIVEITENTPVTIGPVTVTGYSVDHSAYDAYMYLLETPDKTILHTGDFRDHGYRGKGVLPTVRKFIRRYGKRDVDILITEGTMMNRMGEKVRTEAQLQEEARKYFRQHKYVFIICSSTNLDSLASFYQAGKKNGRKRGSDMRLYTYSDYVCQQLRTFTERAGARTGLYKFKDVYTLQPELELSHPLWDKPKKQKELMAEHGFIALIKLEDFCEKYIDEFLELKPVIVYSMWDGYLDPDEKGYNPKWDHFLKRQEAKGVEVKHLHTSGHATAQALEKMIRAVEPREAIYPIHTEKGEGFYELDIPQEMKDKVVLKYN